MRIPLIGSLLERRSRTSGLTKVESWLYEKLGARPALSGVAVNEHTAIRMTAVFACVRILSWTLASLPLVVYRRRDERGKDRATEDVRYRLLHDEPNSEISSFQWRSVSMAHLCLWGNAYSEIESDRQGIPVALWPLPPWRVKLIKGSKTGNRYYEVSLDDGRTRLIRRENMLHIMGLSTNGKTGLSPIGQAREAVGLGMAAEEFGARFFGQGTHIGGFFEHPNQLSDASHERLVKDLRDKYEGLGKSHRVMLLEEGMKYTQAGIPPADAQYLEVRQFQIGEIARLYNVPLHLLQEHEKSTTWGSGIEQINLGFVVHTMRPWLVNWEQELRRRLFFDEPDMFAEFVVEGLLRGDTKNRYDAYATGRQWGWLSANDVRNLENMNPIDGGDVYLSPMNMVPVDQLGEEQIQSGDNGNRSLSSGPVTRSALSRHRLERSYRRVFEDAAARVIRREKADVLRVAEKLLSERSSSAFRDWLEKFYGEHPEFVERHMRSSVYSLAESIRSELAGELDIDEELTAEDEKLLGRYITALGVRHASRSRGQLLGVLNEAHDEGEDQLEAVRERLDEWEERRPGKIAREETIRVGGAVARAIIGGAGYKLIWRNTGSKTCPFCEELDGKVVGADDPFLDEDDVLTSDDGKMRITGPKMHPPIHEGCECTIEGHS